MVTMKFLPYVTSFHFDVTLTDLLGRRQDEKRAKLLQYQVKEEEITEPKTKVEDKPEKVEDKAEKVEKKAAKVEEVEAPATGGRVTRSRAAASDFLE